MRQQVNVNNVHRGMRIKAVLPTKWAEVKSDSPYIWMKGKVTDIFIKDDHISAISVRIKWKPYKYYFKIKIEALPNSDGVFTSIYKI